MSGSGRYVIELCGAPPRKNRRHMHPGGRTINAPEFTALVEALATAWRPRPTLAAGTYRVTIVGRWSRLRTLDDGTRVPYGDVDAPVSSVHDALEGAGVFDNDMRIAELAASREYDPENPGLTITIEALDMVDRTCPPGHLRQPGTPRGARSESSRGHAGGARTRRERQGVL